MNVYWIGYGGHAHLAENLRPIITELKMELTTIHEWENADIKWELSTWKQHLSKADIVIIPSDYKKHPCKSNNKLTQAMSMGKPVICSPLNAYIEIEDKYPGCCLFADSEEEWKVQLKKLRDDEGLRKELSQKSLEAAQEYTIDSIGKKWLNILKKLPKTDIIIPTYNNPQCLKLCIDSIRECTSVPYQIIVINNGTDSETRAYLDKQSDIRSEHTGRCVFAQAINHGLRLSTSPYVCLLNDDTIVSRGWLKELISSCKGDVGLVGPFSNCDKGWLHQYDITIAGVQLLPGTNTQEQIKPLINDIYDYRSPYREVPEREWAAFYCVLIPRGVVQRVGVLDEKFTNSGEDVDYCYRIKRQGYRVIQNYRSFVFHFGAVGRKILQDENKSIYDKNDRDTRKYLVRKWGRKSVVLYSGPSWEKWDYRSLDTGIGGSEVWQIHLARELMKLNYRVISFCDCSKEVRDGDVEYIPFADFPGYVNQNWIDYLILSRSVDPLDLPVRSGRVYVQLHDVWLLNQREKTHQDKVTFYCALSDWHKHFAADYHKISEDKFCLTSNGIDFNRFDKIDVERDPHKMIWASSWDRGLDNVLYLYPYLKKEIPDLTLDVYYGVFNWKKHALSKGDKDVVKRIEKLEDQVKQDGINNCGRVSQKELAEAYKKSSLLFYPGWFSETFFIGGIEAQRSGCPVIANSYAGLKTSLGDSAWLIGNDDPWYPYGKQGREEFLNAAVSILTDKQLWQKWSDKGFKNSEKYSWEKVALKWRDLFNS